MIHLASRHTAPLSRSEINALAVLAKAGNVKARDKIVLSHYRFLVRVASLYAGRGVLMEDLISEGQIGLIRATETYDIERGLAFCSYAVWWIRASITKLITQQSLSIRVPANFYINGDGPSHGHDYKHGLSEEERKEKNKARINKKREAISAIRGSSPLRLDGDYGNALISKEPPADAITETRLNRKRLEQILSEIPVRDADVLRRRFGIRMGETESLADIGNSLGVSRERVRQIENAAKKELKKKYKKEER